MSAPEEQEESLERFQPLKDLYMVKSKGCRVADLCSAEMGPRRCWRPVRYPGRFHEGRSRGYEHRGRFLPWTSMLMDIYYKVEGLFYKIANLRT